STSNRNTAYYPKNSTQWITYRCVRGKTNTGQPQGVQTNNNVFPFPYFSNNKSEFVYDSVTMAGMGFGPGYIKNFRFIISSNTTNVTRNRLQIRMANAPNSRLVTAEDMSFTNTAMQVVFDSVFLLEQCAPNSYKMINLQDTFFYAGSDLIVQFLYDNPVNVAATTVKHIPTLNNKQSLYTNGYEPNMEMSVFSGTGFQQGTTANIKPYVQFYETKHLPLIYDCGVSALAYPSYDQPCNHGTDSVVVWLKNYGVAPMNAVRIWYRIDNQPPVYYDWQGSLNSGDSVRVHLNDNQIFNVGYHSLGSLSGALP
ncbi:MAG: hypothetical protein II388_07840, partial [Clostridia bacterium]|nr:hypothetical protein [Clostridia bacterium]